MYKFIKNNQKKMLAIFGVLLMIVFILPSQQKNGWGRDDVLLGRLGDVKITSADERDAKDQIHDLLQYRFRPLMALGGGRAAAEFNEHPLLYALLQAEARRQGIRASSEAATTVLREGLPDERSAANLSPAEQERLLPLVQNFMLVQALYERAAANIKVTQPLVEHLIAAPEQNLAGGTMGLSVGPFYPAARFRLSTPNGEPMTFGQAPRLNLVSIPGDVFLTTVPAPTEEQIRQQYDKYADASPVRGGGFLTTAPSVPGYRMPARYKVQYLELPAAAVRDAFLKTLTGDERFDVGVIASRYYREHTSEFTNPADATTNPTTSPATGPTSGPTTVAAATTAPTTAAAAKPTTKPFREVESDLVTRVLDGSVASDDARAKPIRQRYDAFRADLDGALRDTIANDYRQFARTAGDGTPTTGPSSAPTTAPTAIAATAPATTSPAAAAAPYDSFEYLERLADAFQHQRGVRPLPHSIADWTSEADLRALPRVGAARGDHFAFPQLVADRARAATRPTTGPATRAAGGWTTYPSLAQAFATTAPAATTQPAGTTQPAATQPAIAEVATSVLLEPSPVLHDADHNAFVFRVTALDPEHRPELDTVRAQIVSDLRTAAAYDRAKQEAKKLLDAAQAAAKAPGDPAGLPQAAAAAGYKVQTSEGIPGLIDIATAPKDNPFGNRMAFEVAQQAPIPGFEQTDFIAKLQFLTQVAPLAQRITPTDRHPSMVVEQQDAHKVLVVEVADVQLGWEDRYAGRMEATLAQEVREQLEAEFASKWFSNDAALARLNYAPANKDKKGG